MVEHVLLLGKGQYPASFLDTPYPDGDFVDLKDYESKVLAAINKYNPKLNVCSIEYSLDEDYFLSNSSKFLGLIAEDIVDHDDEICLDEYSFDWYSAIDVDGVKHVYRPVIYTIMSTTKEGARNITFTQQIFPFLLDLMKLCICSSSYDPGNHPIYLINILNKRVTANTIIRRSAALSLMGVGFIEVFHPSLDEANIPLNLANFCEKYYPDNTDAGITETEDFIVDTNSKMVTVKTDQWKVGRYLEQKSNGSHGVVGSSEKFYWIEVLPVVLIGVHEGYQLDFTQYEGFLVAEMEREGNQGLVNNEKFKRMQILLEYFKKLALLRDE